jgi:plastocyanin
MLSLVNSSAVQLLSFGVAAALLSVAHLAPASAASGESPSGAIEAIVTFVGQIPEDAVADDAGQRRPLLELDKQTRGVHHVVAYLTSPSGKPLPGNNITPPKKPATIDQVNHVFAPRVVAISEGDTVRFKNSDPANHNVRATSAEPRNEFNVFTGVDGSYEHRFARPTNDRPIRLTCDIHPWMRGWIYVFDHPYYATTDAKGTLRIHSIPPGNYNLVIEQPDVSYRKTQQVRVTTNQATRLTVQITDKDLEAPKAP